MFKDELLTKEEVRKHLRIAASTLDIYIKNKKIPYIKLDRRVLFKKSDIDAFLESRKVK